MIATTGNPKEYKLVIIVAPIFHIPPVQAASGMLSVNASDLEAFKHVRPHLNVGAVIVGIGIWSILHVNCLNKEPPE